MQRVDTGRISPAPQLNPPSKNSCKIIDERPKVQMVVKRILVLCRRNKYQDWVKTSGNMLVYSIIQNSRFSYIFDTRGNYGFNNPKIRKIHLLSFPILCLLEKSLEISRSFSLSHFFSKYDWMGASHQGVHP